MMCDDGGCENEKTTTTDRAVGVTAGVIALAVTVGRGGWHHVRCVSMPVLVPLTVFERGGDRERHRERHRERARDRDRERQ